MLPLRIEMQGFLSYKQKAVLDFRNECIWSITGKNAVGKSAVFDAITYALFGEHRGEKQNDQRLLNQDSDFLRVAFDFQIAEAGYRVERTMERRKSRRKGGQDSFGKTCAAFIIDTNCPEDPGQPILGTSSDRGFDAWVAKTLGMGHSAFTASVMLQQGQSDLFVLAKAAKRKSILMEILDLEPYKRLEEAGKRHKDRYSRDLRDAERDLGKVADATQEAVDEAARLRDELEEQFKAKKADLEKAIQGTANAAAHERIVAEIAAADQRLQAALEVIADEKEIEEAFVSYSRLASALPVLVQIVDNREAAVKDRGRADSLRADAELSGVAEYEKAEKEAADKAAEARTAFDGARRKAAGVRRLEQDLRERAVAGRKLRDLSANQASWQEEIDRLVPQLEGLAPAENLVRDCETASSALPYLRQIVEQRVQIANLKVRIEERKTVAEGYREALKGLSSQAVAAREEEKGANDEVVRLGLLQTQATTKLDAARKELATRLAAKNEGTCSRCGQQVDAAHIQREIKDASERVESLTVSVEEIRRQIPASEGQAEDWAAKAAKLERQAEETRGKLNQADKFLHSDESALSTAEQHLKQAASSLPPAYLGKLSPAYPTVEDTSRVQALAEQTHTARAQRDRLRQVSWRKRYLEEEIEKASMEAADLAGRYASEDLPGIAGKHAGILEQLEGLSAAEETAEHALETADTTARKAKTLADGARKLRDDLLSQAGEAERDAEASDRLADSLAATLGDGWPEAISMDRERLDELTSERNVLFWTPGRMEALEEARKQEARHPGERARLDEQLDLIPAEDRISPTEAEERLVAAREAFDTADEDWRQAWAHASDLSGKLSEYTRLKAEQDKASKSLADYDLLTQALGKDGLQARLVQDALRAIAASANLFLANISRGSLRIELKQDGEELEILVTDRTSAKEPLDVRYISGSQRFRVSVALALAIGQYSGGGSRLIRSVIIDEGFGSLDKEGREEMKDQLLQLAGLLDRVLLVSHQEDFQDAFPNGYHIVKDDSRGAIVLPRGWVN